MQDVPRLKTPKGVHIFCTCSEHLDQEMNSWYFAARFSARSRLVVEGREDSAYLLSPAKVLVVL